MQTLSHLDKLEAEAIYILREVAAECEKPVMLYSIGKDSSVMLHLALKAFWPEKPPFPFLHIDTTWKFRDMIAFRDYTMQKYGLDLLVYTNEEGVERVYGSLRRRAPGRGEVPRQGEDFFFPQRTAGLGSKKPASGNVEALQYQDP